MAPATPPFVSIANWFAIGLLVVLLPTALLVFLAGEFTGFSDSGDVVMTPKMILGKKVLETAPLLTVPVTFLVSAVLIATRRNALWVAGLGLTLMVGLLVWGQVYVYGS